MRRGTDPATAKEAARLHARPSATPTGGPTGLHPVELGGLPVGLRYVPAGPVTGPLPLALLFHGAGAGGRQGIEILGARLEEARILVVAPDAAGRTWDAILGGYGPDLERVDALLVDTFERYPVDPARLVVGGFSDGASYAVSLGLANGDLFSHVVAFSPGFAPLAARRGKPPVFVSHGVADRVLPVDACGRRVVRMLREDGYDVRYEEFPGGHAVPLHVVDAALAWLGGG